MLTENPAISVIIPVYNQEKYVGKCIRSVLGQSFKDVEIILVNDGSTDNSLKICQKYASKYGCITIINKQNEGVAYARKDGLLKANGDYICFIDGDDYFADGAIKTLYHLAEEKEVDLVCGGFNRVFDNWGILKRRPPYKLKDRKINKEQILPIILGMSAYQEDNWAAGVAGKLYRRSCIIRAMSEAKFPLFPADCKIEDTVFNFVIAPFLDSIWVSSKIIFHYRYGGITTRDFPAIRKGSTYFDDRVDCCFFYNSESVLPRVLSHYSCLLMSDLIGQIHHKKYSLEIIRKFLYRELTERKIVVWARQNPSLLPDDMKNSPLIKSLLECDVNASIKVVKEREKFLQKHHYWKMKMMRLYMKVADYISKSVE